MMNPDSVTGCASLVNAGTKTPVSINGDTNLLSFQQTNNASSPVQSSLTTVYDEDKGHNQKLSSHNHNESLLQASKYYCEKQEFVDLAIHCEDGVIHAHQIVLAVASPLLKQLFQTNPTYGLDSLAITLPEVKSCLVQALIHFVYTGNVVTQEGQFYSLMKLVYALNINGLIEAESTKNLPTKFKTVIESLGKKKRGDECDDFSSRKKQKVEDTLCTNSSLELKYSNGSLENSSLVKVNGCLPKLPMQSISLSRITMPHLTKPVSSMSHQTHSMSSQSSTMPSVSCRPNSITSLSCQPISMVNSLSSCSANSTSMSSSPSVPSTRVVNSLTASGVVIKEEPEEKPNLSLSQGTHFVAVTSYPVKVEHPCQPVYISSSITAPRPTLSNSSPGSILSITGTGTGTSNQTKDGGSDDPLAAIMNQTIFGGEAMLIVGTAGTQVNGKQYLEIPGGHSVHSVTAGGSVKLLEDGARSASWGGPGREEAAATPQEEESPGRAASASRGLTSETVDDLPCTPDDEDLNISYNCETCNRSIKGRVMLQAHQYQEHFDNPEYDATSIPEEKFACRVCLKVFTRNSDVKAHILRVHCGDRRYPCTMCGKRFKESTHLRKHLYTHTGERPHYCQLCTKGFQTSSDLKRHKRTRVHQERVEQLNNGKLSDTDGGPLDNNAEYNRWMDETEEDLDPGGRTNSSNRLSTAPISNRQNSPLYLPIQSKPPMRPPSRTTHVTRPPQTFPPRLSSSTLPCLSSSPLTTSMVTMSMSSLCNTNSLMSHFPATTTPISQFFSSPAIQFTTSSTSSPSIQFPTCSPSIQLGSSSSIQLCNSSSSNGNFVAGGQLERVGNTPQSPSLSLSNSTIDMSDIKWGLGGSGLGGSVLESRDGLGGSVLESRDELFSGGSGVITVKRSVSTDSPHDGERLTIQEDSMDL